jgi:acid phosphatase type 7
LYRRRLVPALAVALLVIPQADARRAVARKPPTCFERSPTIVGTSGPDVLRGTSKRDVIVGLGGDDVILGLGANDRLCGGAGHDRVYGGRGADRLSGNSGNDSLFGEPGKDQLLGGVGRDGCLQGGTGGGKSSCSVVIAGAGDIACEPGLPATAAACHHAATSDLLVSMGVVGVFTLGDNQYENGAVEKFHASYHPTWGRLKELTYPATGNHEYLTPGAAGHFAYFGAAAGDPSKGYYSYNLDRWHVIVLNSTCSGAGGCGPGSPQETWLRQDLAANPAQCTLAYWHHPRFSSGGTRGDVRYAAFWEALYGANADVVLVGHDHFYERFAPQNPLGLADQTRGIRQFTVGTGGKNHTGFLLPAPNSEVRNSDTFGVLKLTLRSDGYDWQFVPEIGGLFTDSGSGSCH